ncbi:MAG: hypothetical protein AB8C84_09210 [Oligoflexales bacterium]
MLLRIVCFFTLVSTHSLFAAKTLRPIWAEMPKNHDMVVALEVGPMVEVSLVKRAWVREVISVEVGLGFEGSQRGTVMSGVRVQFPNMTPFWPWVLGRVKGIVTPSHFEWRQEAMIGGHFYMGENMEMWIAKGVQYAWFGLRYRV